MRGERGTKTPNNHDDNVTPNWNPVENYPDKGIRLRVVRIGCGSLPSSSSSLLFLLLFLRPPYLFLVFLCRVRTECAVWFSTDAHSHLIFNLILFLLSALLPLYTSSSLLYLYPL